MLPCLCPKVDLFFSVLVPAPVQLTLERQLNKSILIGWNPPQDPQAGSNNIDSYHVYVNGFLKTTIKACERTKALVEGVDSSKVSLYILINCFLNLKVYQWSRLSLFKYCIKLPLSPFKNNLNALESRYILLTEGIYNFFYWIRFYCADGTALSRTS